MLSNLCTSSWNAAWLASTSAVETMMIVNDAALDAIIDVMREKPNLNYLQWYKWDAGKHLSHI